MRYFKIHTTAVDGVFSVLWVPVYFSLLICKCYTVIRRRFEVSSRRISIGSGRGDFVIKSDGLFTIVE